LSLAFDAALLAAVVTDERLHLQSGWRHVLHLVVLLFIVVVGRGVAEQEKVCSTDRPTLLVLPGKEGASEIFAQVHVVILQRRWQPLDLPTHLLA
jgi:hypothetical protein